MRQDQFLHVLEPDDAMRIWRGRLHASVRVTEHVALTDCWGRIAARDLVAPSDVPAFDRSKVDGFAVNAQATFGALESEPIRLRCASTSIHAGIAPDASLKKGEAMPIATGGVVPRGANAIVMVEDTTMDGDDVVITRASVPGAHVSYAGSDLTRGECVVVAGTRLSARETGMLAACGLNEIPCFAPYKVAVISTGDEIVAPGTSLQRGQVHDINGTLMVDALRELGADSRFVGVVPDDESQLRRKLLEAVNDFDAVILSGGTSKGQGDTTYRVVGELCDIAAHGIALKPGKPLCLASHDGKPIAILPGFPTSAVFTFHRVVAPVLAWHMGLRGRHATVIRATLAAHLRSVVGRAQGQLVTLLAHEDNVLAFPLAKGSGAVTAFARSEGVVEVPLQQEYIEEGTEVDVTLLGQYVELPALTIAGSHCLGIDIICSSIRAHAPQLAPEGSGLIKIIAMGSQAGLRMVAVGACDIAPMHLFDPKADTWNNTFLPEEARLLPGYERAQVLAFRSDASEADPLDGDADPCLVAFLKGTSLRIANRNPGSGTRLLLDTFVREQRIDAHSVEGWPTAYRSHTAVANAIASQRADYGICLKQAAIAAGLSWRPWRAEVLDFAVRKDRWNKPAVVSFRRALADPAVRAQLETQGYTPSQFGSSS